MHRERGPHEDRIEILASNEAGVLHPTVGAIPVAAEVKISEQLQRIDDEIERRNQKRRGQAGGKKPDQVFGGYAHQNLK